MSSKILYLFAVFLVGGCSYLSYNLDNGCHPPFNRAISILRTGSNSSVILEAWEKVHPFQCSVEIYGPTQHTRVMLNIVMLNEDKRENCGTSIKIEGNLICDLKKTSFVTNNSSSISFTYYTKARIISMRAFQMYATAYKLEPCDSLWDFRCDNGKCISSELIRDGVDNCGDNSDEKATKERKTGFPRGAIAAIAIGILLLIAFVSGGIWLFKKNIVTAIVYV